MAGLTDKQRDTVEVIRRLTTERGYPPTITEIARTLGIGGATTRARIAALREKGAVVRDNGCARSIRVTGHL